MRICVLRNVTNEWEPPSKQPHRISVGDRRVASHTTPKENEKSKHREKNQEYTPHSHLQKLISRVQTCMKPLPNKCSVLYDVYIVDLLCPNHPP